MKKHRLGKTRFLINLKASVKNASINLKDLLHRSDAFSVDDLGTSIIVILLGDPVTGEGRKGAESGGTTPDGVISIWGSDDLGHTSLGGLLLDLIIKSGINTFIEGGTTREDNVSEEVSSDINITVIDGFDTELSEAKSLVTLLGESRFEDKLGSLESRGVDLDNLSVGELEVLDVLVRG